MPIKRVKFTYEQEMIKEPIISILSKDFDLVTNIRRADVREDMGWVVLEIEGEEKPAEEPSEAKKSEDLAKELVQPFSKHFMEFLFMDVSLS